MDRGAGYEGLREKAAQQVGQRRTSFLARLNQRQMARLKPAATGGAGAFGAALVWGRETLAWVRFFAALRMTARFTAGLKSRPSEAGWRSRGV